MTTIAAAKLTGISNACYNSKHTECVDLKKYCDCVHHRWRGLKK